MIRRICLGTAGVLIFAILATANSGGYRYGVSDQAFYVPALAKSIDPALFPRDSDILAVQMRVWIGDDIVAALSRVIPLDLPRFAAVSYVIGLIALAAALAFFLRGLRASWWAVGTGLALACLRHRIPETGANSLEGYFHPRMLAFALGLWALAFALRRRNGPAFLLVAASGLVHPTTALWFGAALGVAVAWRADRRAIWAVAGVAAAVAAWLVFWGSRMDAAWLAAVAGKDYLFPTAWPAWAWIVNLAYPLVLWAIYRRRAALGLTVAGEPELVTGLMALMAGFLVSVPLSAAGIALAVQLQVTRVLWVLDAVVLLYVAWWLADDIGRRGGARRRGVVLALIIAAAAGRGYYVLAVETGRPLAAWTLPPGEWTDAMAFLRGQPKDLYVLADPGHAWKYGTSVRVSALRDTVLEHVKDSAMAIYDHALALRVDERAQALGGFEDFSEAQIRAVAVRYGADVVVLERVRRMDLPVLYENGRFVVYDLRHR